MCGIPARQASQKLALTATMSVKMPRSIHPSTVVGIAALGALYEWQARAVGKRATLHRLATMASRTAPDAPSGKIEDRVFGGKKYYSMTLNMPNLTSAGGSWIVRFAELNQTRGGGELTAPVALTEALAAWETKRYLVFCDEAADLADPLAALATVPRHAPLAVLVGPEGGFAADERAALLKLPNVVRLALGPRILRADTAAVAALALVQAAIGDWR